MSILGFSAQRPHTSWKGGRFRVEEAEAEQDELESRRSSVVSCGEARILNFCRNFRTCVVIHGHMIPFHEVSKLS